MVDKDILRRDLEDGLTLLVRSFPAEEVIEMLASAYQKNRDERLSDWYNYGEHGESAKLAFQSDRVSQKLLKIGRELEGK